MERSRQLFCSRNFILSALQYNTIQILLSTPHGGFSETSINSTGNQKKKNEPTPPACAGIQTNIKVCVKIKAWGGRCET